MSIYTHKMVNGIEVPLTQEEIDELEARDALFLANQQKYEREQKYKDLREAAYNEQGATDKALLIAMWDRIADGSPTNIAAFEGLESIRQQVKKQFPAPQ